MTPDRALWDRNCNTCIHLERVKFVPFALIKIPLVKEDKNGHKVPAGFREVRVVDGFQHGNCKTPERMKCDAAMGGKHPYEGRFKAHGHMIFHPDDPMHMDCYVPR